MKMNLKNQLIVLISVLIVLITTSCKNNIKEIETASLTTTIGELKINDHIKWIVVLPGLGCHGCIQEAEAFMRDHIKNTEILFVLTKISSLKILQQKIGVQIRETPNVYIDLENEFDIPSDNRIYPCIIQMKDGKMVEHEFQSPQNGACFSETEKPCVGTIIAAYFVQINN